MKFLIFDREENYIGNLKDVLEAKQTEEINGEDVLSIATLDKSIGKGYKLVYKDKYGFWKEFIVKEIEESHTNDGIEKRLFCESSFYEAWGDYIEDKRPTNTSARNALFTALEPTRWEVGYVDDLGANTTNFYRISAKEAVQEVARVWRGEIRTRVEVVKNKITHRYVDLVYKLGGDYGKRFTYTKNLESVIKTVHRDDVITALYGYGKGEEVGDGFGRRIDFADINGGKAYIENMEALSIWGRNNPDGTKSHVFGKVEFDDVEDPEILLQLTQEALSELSSPQVTYEAKVLDLEKEKAIETPVRNVRAKTPYSRRVVREKSYPIKTIQPVYARLGDTVSVIDREFTPELRLKARVVRVVEDLLHPENTNIVLGNFIPNIADSLAAQQKFIDNFRDKQGVWDRSQHIDPDGNMLINNLIDQLNEKLNQQGGYVYLSEDGEGLITYNKPKHENPNMAIQILGGAFRIANSRKPDGSWNWRTFGDGNGFVADAFIGGLLKGGKVNFDLTNGTLLIGENTENYNLYWDGNNLLIKGHIVSTSGEIGGFNITENGLTKSFQKTWGPFTQADLTRVQDIILGNITPSQSDYDKYDINGSGHLSGLDMLAMQKMISGYTPYTVEYTITLNTQDMREMIVLNSILGDSTKIGAFGISAPIGRFNDIVIDKDSAAGAYRLSVDQDGFVRAEPETG